MLARTKSDQVGTCFKENVNIIIEKEHICLKRAIVHKDRFISYFTGICATDSE